ncbi:MAG TPA: hypothetical protein VFZ66_22765 [Herpetosiphonaceae bacterium]
MNDFLAALLRPRAERQPEQQALTFLVDSATDRLRRGYTLLDRRSQEIAALLPGERRARRCAAPARTLRPAHRGRALARCRTRIQSQRFAQEDHL